MHRDLQQKMDSLFQAYDQQNTPGCAIGIVQNGEFIFKKGYGIANLEYDVPITPQSVFCLASLAKQFTGMCIWLLEEEKHLRLEDDIRLYIPEFPAYGQKISIANLLYHTSGIRDYYVLAYVLMGIKSHDFLTQEEALQIIIEQKKLLFMPGDRFHYSNSNYVLLSLIIQRLSGMSIGQFSQQHIFAPLGMKHTFFREDHSQIIKNRAVGYEERSWHNNNPYQQQEKKTYYINTPELEITGDDGVWSTIEDLYFWVQNLSHNQLGRGKQILIEKFLTRGRLTNGTQTGYASGICVDTLDGRTVIEHKGWVNAYLAVIEHFPEEQVSILLLSNNNNLIPWDFTAKIRTFLFNNVQSIEVEHESKQEEHRCAVSDLGDEGQDYTGIYSCEELRTVYTVKVQEGKILLCNQNRHRCALDHFFAKMESERFVTNDPGLDRMVIEFQRDHHGVVKSFHFCGAEGSGWEDLKFVRR